MTAPRPPLPAPMGSSLLREFSSHAAGEGSDSTGHREREGREEGRGRAAREIEREGGREREGEEGGERKSERERERGL